MRTTRGLSRFCIYTIVDSKTLDDIAARDGAARLNEKKPWTTGKTLLEKARKTGHWMPIIFAAAERIDDLLYYAELQTIDPGHNFTTYSFTGLTRIDGSFAISSLTLKSSGKHIHRDFIRPYAICRTPAFLKKQAANGPDISRRKHSSIDRNSAVVAAAVLNTLIPHQALQQLVLKEFATFISHLPADRERVQWAVTLQPTLVRLNIGRIEAFTIFRGRVRVLISEPKMNQALRNRIRKFQQVRYKAIPGSLSIDMPHEQFPDLAEDLRGPHTAFIQQALTEGRKTSYAQSHSPGLMRHLKARFPMASLKMEEPPNLSEQEREDDEINAIQERTDIGPTEKYQLIQAQRGQGVFKSNVQCYEKVCRVTGISDLSHLIASHIKPWSQCTDEERISGHNGLLLAPHVDHLFDAGWISFAGDGALLISQLLNTDILAAWRISDQLNVGAFSSKQSEFLEYHRSHVFKG